MADTFRWLRCHHLLIRYPMGKDAFLNPNYGRWHNHWSPASCTCTGGGSHTVLSPLPVSMKMETTCCWVSSGMLILQQVVLYMGSCRSTCLISCQHMHCPSWLRKPFLGL